MLSRNGGPEHHLVQVAEAFVVELLHRRHVLQPGVVDQHVDPAGSPCELVGVGQVRAIGHAADLRRHPRRRLAVAVDDQHLCPGLRQSRGAGLAYSAAAAGHHRGSPLQVQPYHTHGA